MDDRREGERVHAKVEEKAARVLLAEDDEAMRLLLSSVLRKDGYEVTEAESGSEVLDLLYRSMAQGPSFKYDVIISDIRMPGLGGFDVLSGLRESDWATPVILITGFGGPETRDQARRWGATAVFDKPFNVNDLRRVITSVMGAANR